jgi:hypothetical protein
VLQRVSVKYKSFEPDQEIGLSCEAVAELEFREKDSVQIKDRYARVLNDSNFNVTGEVFSKLMDEDGFARADITGEKQESLVFQDSILERRKAFQVLFAQPQEFRVGLDLEGVESEIVVLAIHGGGPKRRGIGCVNQEKCAAVLTVQI